MKKAIQFVIGAVSAEIGLISACYLDLDGAKGTLSAIVTVAGFAVATAMYYWHEVDKRRQKFDRRIKRNRRALMETLNDYDD